MNFMSGKEMDDEARQKLAEKLDKDLETYVTNMVEERKKLGITRPQQNEMTVDELAEELKQHPAFMTEFDETKPMSTAMEGLQAAMYESESKEDNAQSYKEDGNRNFERKKYRWAIDNYTAGIQCKADDKLLNAILYTNRAAANYHLGNYLSSFNDCVMARKFKPDHTKAILRGVLCSLERKTFETAIQWCDDGLMISQSDSKLIELRAKANKLLKQQERDKRKELANQKKETHLDRKLINAITQRGIKLGSGKHLDEDANDSDNMLLTLDCLEPCHPSGAKVTIDADGVLFWPVLLLYPEFGETDFIMSFSENSRFTEHLEAMFGPDVDRPAWDLERRYTPTSIEIYYEEQSSGRLHLVPKTSTLLSVLQDSSYIVITGTPNFYILVKDSAFTEQFLARHV